MLNRSHSEVVKNVSFFYVPNNVKDKRCQYVVVNHAIIVLVNSAINFFMLRVMVP